MPRSTVWAPPLALEEKTTEVIKFYKYTGQILEKFSRFSTSLNAYLDGSTYPKDHHGPYSPHFIFFETREWAQKAGVFLNWQAFLP